MASDGIFISNRPQLAIARETASFSSLGLNDPSLVRVIYQIGNPFLSYIPSDEYNAIQGITNKASYLLYVNSFYDGSPALANAALDNLIPQTTTNVFAGERTVFYCTTSVDFATAGITTSNTKTIVLCSEGYFISYDPNETENGISGFVQGELYDIDPILDIDLHLYGVTEFRYSDEVLYLDSLEDVVVTNSNPTATLPLAEEEVLVRNITTGAWENKPVSDLPTGTSYTDEQAQDAVGTILSSEFTYNDATPQISVNQIAYSKLTGTPTIPTQYTDEMAQDATAALFAAGTHTGITFTYDDAGNKISAAVTGSGTTPGIDDVLAVGQSLTANRSINTTAAFSLSISGAVPSATAAGTLQITNTSTTGACLVGTANNTTGTAIAGNATSGTAVYGNGNTGVHGNTTSGIGVNGAATTGTGLTASATTGVPAQLTANPSTSNTVVDVLRVERNNSGGAGAPGIGAAINFRNETASNFNTQTSNRIISKWTDATLASRTSQMIIEGVNNASTVNVLTLGGQGYMQLLPIAGTAASAITASAGMIVFVNSTDATFTSVGFWGYDGTSWNKF